ncbi:predicted protein [Naegleria gruberi]|uniref:Predicted protein n=1 Tax=Naegleria gruberi TaxID=5762 RepID=D2VMY0_NAEGR|nr:uncharacterized protein NAEGRDRAFT_70299 [Naegleria gruberi]EFC41821.1 predicted protein [Naegleria gruberi]|eukprot:XP_002674565.1 predicted protein [Naegleria gruberi strain NEG-M]
MENSNQQQQQCDAGQYCLADGFCITEVSLIPTCILALIVGVYTCHQIRRRFAHVRASWMYSLTFLCFAIMMTDSMFVHCFVPRPDPQSKYFVISMIVNLINLGGTTSIAVGFFFCGLADIKWIDGDSFQSKLAYGCSFVAVFLAWYLALINQWKNMFLILYGGMVGLFCGLYLVMQIILLARSTHHEGESEFRAIMYFILCGISGAVGLGAVFIWRNQICSMMGPVLSPYLGPTFVWFILSDVAVYFLFKYVEETMSLRDTSQVEEKKKKVYPNYNPYTNVQYAPMQNQSYIGNDGKVYTYTKVSQNEHEDIELMPNSILPTHRHHTNNVF